ncbi:hypothetical protein [Gardnerella vaginalis]|uniref:hypothetical protein n=1 Tax=Gardnerella vaginalis TaxID=2702 RepID=UPI0035C71B01
MTTTNPSKHTSSKSSRKRSEHKVHTLPLATMAALLTAATCLGSQPAMAAPTTTITPPTYTATAKRLANGTGAVYKDREADVVVNNPEWLKTPSILEFQRYRSTNDENKDKKTMNSDDYGSEEHNTLIKKTDMYAHIETIDGAKYLVFDVFFNNDAQSMIRLSNRQWYIWQVPYQIAKLNSDGSYASDTIRDLRFDAYKLKDASQNDKINRKLNFTLSRDFSKFEKVDNQSTSINFPIDNEKNFGGNRNKSSSFHYSLGPNLVSDEKYGTDMKNLFHENHDDYALSKATHPEPPYSGKNYGIGIQTSEVNLAFHMHAAVKLNSTAINENAETYDEKYANIHNAWTWADSASYARTTSSSYVWISGRDPESDEDKKLNRHKDDKIAPKIYYKGKEITNNQTINLHTGDKLIFTTSDNKGYIEKFSISGLTKDPTVTQGTGSEDKQLSSGEIIVTQKMKNKKVIITSEDGSGNVTKRKVTVKVTTLADENPLKGKTIDITVGEPLPKLTEIDKFVTGKNGKKLEKQPTLTWNGNSPAPSTETVGVFTRSIKGTYSDKSVSTTDVTIKVKPKKPVINTDLTDLAGKKGQKVTVSVGNGIPADATTTVKLFGKDNKEIGSTTTIKDGKAEITVNGEIPEGDVYATTNVMRQTKKINAGKITIPGFELTSEKSDTKRATKPKDAQDPTITATATSSPVTVGQDLKIHIVAKDDVKVEEVPNAPALAQGLGLDVNELSSRIKSSQTTNTDTEKDFDLTVKNMQPKEVGTHTITFTVTDSAGKTGTATLTITVKPAAPAVEPQNDGSVNVTPADDTDTLEITYTPEGENTNPTNFTVKKDGNGKWKKGDNTPEGVTVDENTGKVTIPANKVKDGSDVKAKDKKGENSSSEVTGKAKNNPAAPATTPAAPTVTPKDDGSVEVTPADDTDTLEITYTPEGENTNPTNFTVKKDGNGKWKKGDNTPEGVTVDENTGKVTIPANKVKDGSDVKAKDKKGENSSSEVTGKAKNNPAAPATTPAAPTVTPKDDGSVEVTPADDTDTLEITYTPEGENTNPTNFTVKKDGNGKWKKGDNTPEGVTVDENTGKVTIPANKVKDGSDVKAKDKKGENSSSEVTGKAKNNPAAPATTPAAPTVTPKDDGSVEVTPADDTDTLEITYTPEGENTNPTNFTVKKDGNGKWKKGDNTPEGVTVDENTGKVTIPANKVKDGSDVKAKDKKGENSSSEVTGKAKNNPAAPATTPAAPTVTPKDDGSVEVTPADDTDTLEITYTPEGENTNPTNFTVKKDGNGKWKKGDNTPEGVTVDENTGKVTIPANKVKDGSDVKAKDKKGENSSSEVTGKAKNNPAAPATTPAAPTVTPKDDGSVEVTPADDTDTLEITYTPEGENTNPTNFTVKKDGNGKWKKGDNTPEGVTVDENTGKVTIPANKVKDGSDVKAKDKKGENSSSEVTGKAKNNPAAPATTPAAPTVTPKDDGSVEVTPADDTDTLEITYTPEGENTNPTNFTVKKDGNGKWKKGDNTPEGVTVDENTGKVTIPANKVKDGSDVKAKDKKGENSSSEVTGKAKNNPAAPATTPAAPTVTPKDDGSVEVTPADDTDTLEITYTPEGENTNPTNFTVKKDGNGKWKKGDNTPEGVTVDENTGKVTIPANKVKDGSDVKAKDKKGENSSSEVTGKAKNNPAAPATTPAAPTVTPKDDGSVEVTPADDTDTLEITYTPEGENTNPTNFTVKKDGNGKWKKGDNTPEGVTVDENTGKVTIPANKVKDGSDVKAKDKKGENSSSEVTGKAKNNPAAPATTPAAPTVTPKDDGSVEVTPADDTDTLEITYTPEGENTNPTNFTVKKDGNGKWKKGDNTPEGVTVDENTGKVTIPANKVKDGSDVKAKDKKGENSSSEVTGKAKNNPAAPATTPAAPTVTPKDDGSVEVTPADDTDTLEITYTPEGENTNPTNFTVKKDGNGKWKKGDNTPEGVTVDENTGKVTIPANKVKDGSDVKAKDKKGENSSSEVTGKAKNNPAAPATTPAAPTVTPKDDGSVEVTPADDTDTLEITYTPEGENTNPTNFTVKKDGNGKWKKGDNTPEGVTVDENTGKVTIPANKVKDGSDVKAKDKKGENSSSEVTGKAKNNPAAPATTPAAPTVTPKDDGSVEVTPADDTDTLEITYTPEGENTNPTNFTVKKDGNGKWKKGDNTPEGVTVDENTGKVTIPANKVKDGSDVKAKDKKGENSSSEVTGKAKNNPAAPATTPAAPTVTPKDDGSVEVTPADDTDTLEITYTPEGENTNPTNFTVKKDGNGKWKKGDNTPEGVTVDENTGKVTIPANKVKDGSDVKAKDKKGENSSSEVTGKAKNNPAAPATTPAAPTVTPKDDGSVEVTPADDTDTLEITYTPEGENTNPTNFTVKKDGNGKWKKGDNTPEGVTVDENTGKVTIPANKVKDGSDVKAKDKKGENSSSEVTGKAKNNPAAPATTPAAPTVTPKDDGSVEVTPADDTDTLEITYTPEGENTNPTNFTVKKDGNGKWKKGDNTPEGVTVDENTGKVTIPANKVKDGSDVKAKDKKGENSSSEVTGKAKNNPAAPATTPAAPTVTPKDDGSVEVTPADDTDTLEITYTPEGENTNPTNFTVKKDGNGKWKKGDNTPEGVTVDENTGKVTIPANKVKDGSDVKAKDKKGENSSSEVTGKAKNNPAAPATTPAAPTVTPKDDGSVEVTPADDTDTLEITYTPEGENTNPTNFTVKKDGNGKWKKGDNTPEGVTVDENTGKVTIPANKVKDGSDVKAKDKKGENSSSEVTGKAKNNPAAPATTPAAPTVTPKDDGSVEVTPADDTDTLEITYTPEGENTNPTNFTVKKDGNGKWKKGDNTPEGVTVDENTGKVTIPANKVKDGSDVKAKDKKGDNSSSEVTGKAKNNGGNSGSGTGSDSGSGSDSGNDSTPNNGGSTSGSTTGGSSSTDSGAQNSTNESSSADNANNAGNAETGNAGNSNAGNASTGASGSNASNKSGNKVPAKHSSQLVKTGAEVERVGLISAMIGVLGAAAAFFSRKKNRE